MSVPELEVIAAFASPIITAHRPDSAGLNEDLRRLFLSRESQGDRYRKRDRTPTTQVNIFESEFDLFTWPEPPVQELRQFCLAVLGQVVHRLNDFAPEQRKALETVRLLVDSWFHVTRNGGFIAAHTHPMASWSGVYCVCPGRTPAEHPRSGVLRFTDARPYANMYVDPGNVRMKPPFGSGGIEYALKAGQLVLFPSYLVHEAAPFFGDDERITVAFNCSFATPPGAKAFGF
jgi:uncharacterized protein (TIGR02466 family)